MGERGREREGEGGTVREREITVQYDNVSVYQHKHKV